ncbi:MAG: sulfur carrier protein ThiS [Pseudomonadales bacterium]|nr:sulfur carrier protein ThiS [Pseudomonadales bacterium]
MNIILNGESATFEEPLSVADLVVHMGLQDKRIAVEINLEIIPAGLHPTQMLREADRVEVVAAIGGG